MTEESGTVFDLSRGELHRDIHSFVGILGRYDEPLSSSAKAKVRHGAKVEIGFIKTMHKCRVCGKDIQLNQFGLWSAPQKVRNGLEIPLRRISVLIKV